MITDHHGRIEKKPVESDIIQSHNNNNYYNDKWYINLRVTMGYQLVMNVRIILIYCYKNVNRTIVFLILIY